MTYRKFLAALKDHGPWMLNGAGEIVQERAPIFCPWLAVEMPRGTHRLARGKKGVGAETIWDAADGVLGHTKAIRRDLLRACGLKERA